MNDDDNERMPREMRTPISCAEEVLDSMAVLLDEWLPTGPPESLEAVLLNAIFSPMQARQDEGQVDAFVDIFVNEALSLARGDKTTNGDEVEDLFFELAESSESKEIPVPLLAALLSGTYCFRAKKSQLSGNTERAWTFVADANDWAGIAICSDSVEKERQDNGLKQSAAALAKKCHAENYALREEVEKFWIENIDPNLSAQKAAEEVKRANLVPLSHKKIAEIISALRKAEPKRRE